VLAPGTMAPMKIGAVMPIAEGELGGRTATFSELRAVAQAAEAGGLDSIWVYDHLLFRFPPAPTSGIYEAWSILAALAADTTRVELGTLVMAIPFRNPAVFAKMAATVDEISGGRLILGIGAGWHEPEFEAFGIPFDHRVSRFEEALQIILPMLRSGRADVAGRYHRADDVELLPRGPRPSGLPILIAGRGPRMLSLVAKHADAWNAAWFGDVSEIEPRVAPLREALAAAGRDPATLDITIGINVVLPDLVSATDELPAHALRGTPMEIAAGLRGYADAGVSHLIAACTPSTVEAMDRFSEAARLSR
jgi:probable F420-dependent oxidoreductase